MGIDNKLHVIDKAEKEARRFLLTCKKWKWRLKKENISFMATKEGGACKRASLDLTRALAELRNPKYR